MTPHTMGLYAQLCGGTLARAHARSGDRIAIASYLGGGDKFDQAMADFAESYADQNERDYEAFSAAADSGRVEVDQRHLTLGGRCRPAAGSRVRGGKEEPGAAR